jgi:hypothetical protein
MSYNAISRNAAFVCLVKIVVTGRPNMIILFYLRKEGKKEDDEIITFYVCVCVSHIPVLKPLTCVH